MDIEDRLKRLFAASPEQMEAIEGILEFGVQKKSMASSGPLLMGMSASAKLLGVSRPTLYSLMESHGLAAEQAQLAVLAEAEPPAPPAPPVRQPDP